MEGIWKGYLFFQKWYINLGFPFIFSKIDLAQNKMEQQTRSPPNQGWSRTKGRYAPLSHIWFGGRRGGGGGLGFPFILSKIDLAQNKMKQQTRSPHIKDEAVWRAKTQHFLMFDLGGGKGLSLRRVKGKNTEFSHLWFGGRGGGGSRFSILFCPILKIPLTF